MSDYAIGQLAATSGCSVQTLRHYEAIGLLPPPARSTGGQRRYGPAHAERLAFIRHARDLGLGLADIRALIGIAADPDASCAQADAIIHRHLAEAEARIARLTALRQEFIRMLDHGQGGRVAECRIIDTLADHEQCLAETHGGGGGPDPVF